MGHPEILPGCGKGALKQLEPFVSVACIPGTAALLLGLIILHFKALGVVRPGYRIGATTLLLIFNLGSGAPMCSDM